MNIYKHIKILLLTIVFVNNAYAQPELELQLALAKQYMENQEYDKALHIYQILYTNDSRNTTAFNNYLNCLILLKDYTEAEKILNKQIKKNPGEIIYLFTKAQLYETQNKIAEADKLFNETIHAINPKYPNQANQLANLFIQIEDYDRAIKVYETTREKLKDPSAYYFELGDLYQRKGDLDKMADNYFNFISTHPEQVQIVQNNLQAHFEKENYTEIIQSQLFKRTQSDPNNILWPELLIWLYLQKKDFYAALIQAKALDKKGKENGERVYSIARTAYIEQYFDDAIEAFQYVISKGEETPLYLPAYTEMLAAQKDKVLLSDYTDNDLFQIEKSYIDFLNKYKISAHTAITAKDLALIQARYLDKTDTAIALLQRLIELPSMNNNLKAECKLDLGDYYVMQNNIWDSYLYYAQVDKAHKDGPLGEMARFRNARLSYFNGDFEWAQAQLTVLKASTSELIANDALDLSIFIQDNTGLDTVFTAMRMFARSELFLFQNKKRETILTLDSIDLLFPNHNLADDIMMVKAKIARLAKNYTLAVTHLENIVQNYDDGILSDDALFMLGEIYEYQIKDIEKAKLQYEAIIINKPDSVFSVEARKRFRRLRGDKI